MKFANLEQFLVVEEQEYFIIIFLLVFCVEFICYNFCFEKRNKRLQTNDPFVTILRSVLSFDFITK
jgi:hypothetical protein